MSTTVESPPDSPSGLTPCSPLSCECSAWARATSEDMLLHLSHHPKCDKATTLLDVRRLLDDLLLGIEAWAGDEDGVHPECWDAYLNACAATMRPVSLTGDKPSDFIRSRMTRLQNAIGELTATVRGECPSLLNEDSGGNGRLAIEIDELLGMR